MSRVTKKVVMCDYPGMLIAYIILTDVVDVSLLAESGAWSTAITLNVWSG